MILKSSFLNSHFRHYTWSNAKTNVYQVYLPNTTTIWTWLVTQYVGLLPLESNLESYPAGMMNFLRQFDAGLHTEKDIDINIVILTSFKIIYSHQNESKCTEITEILRIVFVTSINRGNHVQWTDCVKRIITAEGTFIKKIFVQEYRKLTIILTKLTSFEHYSYPTAVIVTWKWDFIAANILKNYSRSMFDLD